MRYTRTAAMARQYQELFRPSSETDDSCFMRINKIRYEKKSEYSVFDVLSEELPAAAPVGSSVLLSFAKVQKDGFWISPSIHGHCDIAANLVDPPAKTNLLSRLNGSARP